MPITDAMQDAYNAACLAQLSARHAEQVAERGHALAATAAREAEAALAAIVAAIEEATTCAG